MKKNETTGTAKAVIDEQGVLTKYGWRSGEYHKIIKTRKDYYNAVHKFVEKYGVVLDKQMTVYHNAGGNRRESEEYLGCGWNTENLNSTIFTAKQVHANKVYVLTIPKGAKVVLLNDDAEEYGPLIGLEDEAVVDMMALGLIGSSDESYTTRYDYGLRQLARFWGRYNYTESDWLTQREWDKWCLCDEVFDQYTLVDERNGIFEFDEQVTT